MASKIIVVGCPSIPIDTRIYQSTLTAKITDAEVQIAAEPGTIQDIQFVSYQNAIFAFIRYTI